MLEDSRGQKNDCELVKSENLALKPEKLTIYKLELDL